MNSIYTSAGDLDGQGVVSDRLWGGINAQFNRGINPSEFDINHSGNAGAGFSGACVNRGPIYISAQTNYKVYIPLVLLLAQHMEVVMELLP